MIPTHPVPTHPTIILERGLLDVFEISQLDVAAHVGVPDSRIIGSFLGRHAITPETAWPLAQALGTVPAATAGGSSARSSHRPIITERFHDER